MTVPKWHSGPRKAHKRRAKARRAAWTRDFEVTALFQGQEKSDA
jgi:hypothetical protein